MTFESSKTLGGVGALLLFIGFIPPVAGYTFAILPLVGLILLLIGMKGLAEYYREAGIFNNALYGTIVAIVGVIASIALTFTVFLSSAREFFMEIMPTWDGDWANLGQINPADINTDITYSSVASFLATILIMFVIAFIVVLIVTILYRKSLTLLRDRSGVGLFGSAGTVLLIGGVLTIIFGLGLILVWIATLLIAIAFFQLKEPSTQTAQPYQYPPEYPSTQV